MKTVGTIGHVDHRKTTLTAAIKSVLEKEQVKVETILEEGEKVYQFQNPYNHILDVSKPSKSRLKKCEKGLHEFSETNYTEKTEVGTKKLWACNHCGTFMHNR
jgi:translation initiation factor 2 gamma subunit (eIF-2gamma)